MFKSIFVDNFLPYFEEHPTINLMTERIKLNLLFKPSNLHSNFPLTLGYLNPALNNPALVFNFFPQETRKSLLFHRNHILGTVDFTGSEHSGLPSIFLRAQSLWEETTGDVANSWQFLRLKPTQCRWVQHCWIIAPNIVGRYMLCPFAVTLLPVATCCWEFLRNLWNRSNFSKPCANRHNNSKHWWTNNVGSCCVHLDIA